MMIWKISRLIRVAMVVTLTTLTVCVCVAQNKTEKIDALMNLYRDYGRFNGSVLVADHGSVIYEKGLGCADMEWDIPNAADTKFRLGSITKQFTAMVVLQLVEQGKIRLDGKITDYLPDYPGKTGNIITIHNLLTHTSGILGYTEIPNFRRDLFRNPYSPEQFVKVFQDSALLFAPGSRFSYSNSGYFLLGVIIEKVTGKPYEEVLQEKIFAPLGMKNSGYDHYNIILRKRARGYERRGGDYLNAEYFDSSNPYSAGSLYSTVEDLYLWDQALYTDKLLPVKTRDLLFGKYIPAFGGWYGYGWVTAKSAEGKSTDSVTTISHGGSINGFNALILRVPEEQELIVLLNNTGGAPLNDMSRGILGILRDKPYSLPKRSLADTLFVTMLKNGPGPGLALFHDMKEHHADTYAISEREMNENGYVLLQRGKVKEAIEIFKLNVAEYPKSSNVYDSLGEAYMVDGDKELAIKNYQKSVELDPTNENGIQMLKKLESK